MEEQEVERVARLMHDAYREWYTRTYPAMTPPLPFYEQTPKSQQGYRVAARAVLADLCLGPIVVTGNQE